MALCLIIEPQYKIASESGNIILPWAQLEAEYSNGQYSCFSGTHLLMTVAEINAMPKAGVPDAVVMRDHFFLSFGLVLSCWLLGRMVGSVLHLIKGEKDDY